MKENKIGNVKSMSEKLNEMAGRKDKRAFICISDDGEDADERVEDGGTEDEGDDDNGDDDDDDYGGEQEEEAEDDGGGDEQSDEVGDDEARCNKVISCIKEGSDLDCLNLKECKAYLRRHGLRISGTKAVCIRRIQEHRRLKDGNGERLYPRSSFAINCTGDVCKGDVVLFTQKVYEKFDKVTRHGRVVGKRTVAGRVVKESYGAAKQQHTFTVEVLWSWGIKKLSPLFPLLVKGRNLYKLRTFRQPWSKEAERSKVLDEKHTRGGAARHVRAMKRSKKCAANGDEKRRKQSLTRPDQNRKTNEIHVDRLQKRTSRGYANHNSFGQHRVALPSKQMTLQHSGMSKPSQGFRRHHEQKSVCRNIGRVSALNSQSLLRVPHQPEVEFQHTREPFPSFVHAMGTSTMLRYPTTTNVDTYIVPGSQL